VRSVNTVKRWIELGILAGTWDEHSGRWQIPLAEVLRLRGTQQALAEAGGEDLTAEILLRILDPHGERHRSVLVVLVTPRLCAGRRDQVPRGMMGLA
jgi:hypothetical protein